MCSEVSEHSLIVWQSMLNYTKYSMYTITDKPNVALLKMHYPHSRDNTTARKYVSYDNIAMNILK